MADVTKVKASDGTLYDINDVNDYTKDEVDALLADKADVGVSYSKAEADALLESKANVIDVYDKVETDGLLETKADTSEVYSKSEADALLLEKANASDVYTIAQADALLADKANSDDVYTITQTDGLLANKAGVDDSSTTATMATWSASKLAPEFQSKADSSDVYTKAEVDALIGGIKMFPILDYANPIAYTSGMTISEECYAILSFNSSYRSAAQTFTIDGTNVSTVASQGDAPGAGCVQTFFRLVPGNVISSAGTIVKLFKEVTS